MSPFSRLIARYKRLGRTDRVLGILIIATAALSSFLVFRLAFLLLFTWGALRFVRYTVRKAIWRLRNRLIVAYMFIAVVPILLITALVGIVLYAYTGQVAVFLVTSELDRRAGQLRGMAQYLNRITPPEREEWAKTGAGYLRERFPGMELHVTGPHSWAYPPGISPEAPAKGWGEASGLLVKDDLLYLWAHTAGGSGRQVTILLPLTHELLGELVPNLGEISVLTLNEDSGATRKLKIPRLPGVDPAARAAHNKVPDPYNAVDRAVVWGTPIMIAIWDSNGASENQLLRLRTRPSAVLQTIFAQKFKPFEGAIAIAFGAVAIGFLIAEIASLLIGVTISRTITSAVHDLYEGTERVMQGDFSHRIAATSNDQLGELGRSFNNMTGNIQRLLEISKEKERLQSEIEIAREVQNQLFPRTMPALAGLRLTAHCNAARIVSGDYYDYQCIDDTKIALAVGDVAGKGISAALLMATVQSSLRTQIRACLEYAAAAGNGGSQAAISTSKLVSQLNQQLHAHTSPEKFATFYFGIYDDVSGTLTYTNAGHLPPILFHDGEPSRLEVNGMVVGAFPFAVYEESRVQLEPGDLLVCFTDGITEPENEYGEMFGEDRLTEVVGRHLNCESEEEVVDAVMQAVRAWTGSPELQDDMTLLLARRQ